MTKDEFEQMYAKRSGVTVEWLHDHNRIGLPCSCGINGCEGWQMAHLLKRELDFVQKRSIMKLYAFQPKGHGQKSFFVMAESEKEAKEFVAKKIAELLANEEDGISYSDYDFSGWGTDYYCLEVFEVGQVVLNDND
jgi:hypothetical protein